MFPVIPFFKVYNGPVPKRKKTIPKRKSDNSWQKIQPSEIFETTFQCQTVTFTGSHGDSNDPCNTQPLSDDSFSETPSLFRSESHDTGNNNNNNNYDYDDDDASIELWTSSHNTVPLPCANQVSRLPCIQPPESMAWDGSQSLLSNCPSFTFSSSPAQSSSESLLDSGYDCTDDSPVDTGIAKTGDKRKCRQRKYGTTEETLLKRKYLAFVNNALKPFQDAAKSESGNDCDVGRYIILRHVIFFKYQYYVFYRSLVKTFKSADVFNLFEILDKHKHVLDPLLTHTNTYLKKETNREQALSVKADINIKKKILDLIDHKIISNISNKLRLGIESYSNALIVKKKNALVRERNSLVRERNSLVVQCREILSNQVHITQ